MTQRLINGWGASGSKCRKIGISGGLLITLIITYAWIILRVDEHLQRFCFRGKTGISIIIHGTIGHFCLFQKLQKKFEDAHFGMIRKSIFKDCLFRQKVTENIHLLSACYKGHFGGCHEKFEDAHFPKKSGSIFKHFHFFISNDNECLSVSWPQNPAK